MNDEKALIKTIIRAHLLSEDSTTVCRAVIEGGINRGALVEELSRLDDADFMRQYARMKKRFME